MGAARRILCGPSQAPRWGALGPRLFPLRWRRKAKMRKYFVDVGGQTTGPMTIEDVAKLHRKGSITDQTIYTYDGAPGWYPIGYLRPQFPGKQQSALAPCVIAVLLLTALLLFRHWQAASTRNEDEQRAIARLKMAIDGIQAGCLAQITYQEFRQREMDFEVAIQNGAQISF
jgi:hypothetical protein